MAILNPVQIAQVTYRAGWRGVDWIRAIAISLAESGGNTEAYNPESASPYAKPGGGSRGIFQIFTSVHPEFSGMNLNDPQQNANAAFQLYKRAGNRFGDWTTYTGGAYNKYLSTAANAAAGTTQAVANMAGKAGQVVGGAAVNTVSNTVTAPIATTESLVNNIINSTIDSLKNSILGKTASGEQREGIDLAFFLGGLALVTIGLIMLFINSGPGQKIIAVTGKAAQAVTSL